MNCQAMGHHHPHVNHFCWQHPHAQGLAFDGVAQTRTEIAAALLCERRMGLVVNSLRIAVIGGSKLMLIL